MFPLATPLIAGPGAIGATMLLMAEAEGDRLQMAVVVLVLLGVLLAALAVRLIVDGVGASGIVS